MERAYWTFWKPAPRVNQSGRTTYLILHNLRSNKTSFATFALKEILVCFSITVDIDDLDITKGVTFYLSQYQGWLT